MPPILQWVRLWINHFKSGIADDAFSWAMGSNLNESPIWFAKYSFLMGVRVCHKLDGYRLRFPTSCSGKQIKPENHPLKIIVTISHSQLSLALWIFAFMNVPFYPFTLAEWIYIHTFIQHKPAWIVILSYVMVLCS